MTSIPLTRRGAAKRETILRAARILFLSRGYATSSTDELASAAGVSKQTLYAYFPGKAELLAAVVAHELDDLLPAAAPSDATSLAELRGQLLMFARALLARLLSPDGLALLRLLVGEAAQRPELRALVRQSVPQRLLDGVSARLAAAHTRGLIRAPDPLLAARMFIGPLMSYVALDGLLGSTEPQPPDEADLTRLTDFFLKSVEAQP